jgi:uncharacterized protein YdaU (DUF1376 family)
MAKDPAFLFYPGDYLGGTMGMSFEEKGAYMELLMMQFNAGHMTSHMIGQVVGQLWVKIQHKFIKDDKGLYFNVRLEEEQNKRKRFTDSRKNNIKGKNQHTKKKAHMTSHMENENEDEDTNELKYLDMFSKFHAKYQGKKRISKTDFYHLVRLHSDWRKVIPLLEKAVDIQNEERKKLIFKSKTEKNIFVPVLKNLSNWLEYRGWEETESVEKVIKRCIVCLNIADGGTYDGKPHCKNPKCLDKLMGRTETIND